MSPETFLLQQMHAFHRLLVDRQGLMCAYVARIPFCFLIAYPDSFFHAPIAGSAEDFSE